MPRSPGCSDGAECDETLMARYVDGDAAAFEELFRRYDRRAFAYFSRRTASADRAEDLYQELFLHVHRARHAYDPSRPFASWFFQIAHHLLIDDARRAFRHREMPLVESVMIGLDPERAELVVDSEWLARALGCLSDGERTVLLASKGEGASHAEIAARLGKTTDAVKKSASRALHRLRRAAFAEAAVPARSQ